MSWKSISTCPIESAPIGSTGNVEAKNPSVDRTSSGERADRDFWNLVPSRYAKMYVLRRFCWNP